MRRLSPFWRPFLFRLRLGLSFALLCLPRTAVGQLPSLEPSLGKDSAKREKQTPDAARRSEALPRASGQKDARPQESQGRVGKTFTVEHGVRFAVVAGKKLRADMFVPTEKGRFPGVLMIHGGGWTAGSKAQMVGHAQMAAERGYTVMSINYRLAPKHKFPAQIHDCKTAIRWWRERAAEYQLDPDRIAAYGYSAGGHLACMMGVCDPNVGLEGDGLGGTIPTAVQAVVAGGAPCDFRGMPPESTMLSYWLEGTRAENPKVYQQASPQAAVSSDDPPTFFYHGSKDWLVPIHSAQKMKVALDAAGVLTRFHTCEGKGHINSFMNRDAMLHAMDFLDEVLKGQTRKP